MGKLSPETIEQIETYAEDGKSGTWIANKMGLPSATVNYRMLRAGYDPWPGGATRDRTNQPGAFSDEEDARILELSKSMGHHRVAKEMGRPKTSVLIRLMTLEVRAEKKLEAA